MLHFILVFVGLTVIGMACAVAGQAFVQNECWVAALGFSLLAIAIVLYRIWFVVEAPVPNLAKFFAILIMMGITVSSSYKKNN